MFLTTPTPHREAVRAIAGKSLVTRQVFNMLPPEVQALAFTVSGIENFNVLARIQEAVASVPAGKLWNDAKADIAEAMEPWFNAESAAKRAELLLRLHCFRAYAATNHRLTTAHADAFPFCQYISTNDNNVRATHQALHGKIFPTNSPFWINHTGPWEWGCRCEKVALTEDEAGEYAAEDDLSGKPPEARRVMSGALLERVEQIGELHAGPTLVFDVRTPRERTGDPKAFEWRAGDINLPLEQIRARYAPDVWQTFQAALQRGQVSDGRSVYDVLRGVPANPTAGRIPGKPTPAPAAPPQIAPGAPAGRRTAAGVRAAVDALQAELSAKEQALTQANAALTHAAAAGNMPAALQHVQATAAARDAVIERARDAAAVPPADRGKVRMPPNKTPLVQLAKQGAAIVERYTAKALLPGIAKVVGKRGRAHYRDASQSVHASLQTTASTMAHEITHATEMQNPAVLQASGAFLLKRAAGQATEKLSKLTGNPGYKSIEIAYEDEWVKRGGAHYCGKLYKARGAIYATELLTMGIERLHASPLEFAKNDPEYFDFVVSTLQQIAP